jgi:hypothetical protein
MNNITKFESLFLSIKGLIEHKIFQQKQIYTQAFSTCFYIEKKF